MARTISYVFGAILAVVGLWGFVQNPVLGIFDANSTHSIIHLLSGLILLAVVLWAPAQNALALKIFGVIYAIVAVLGFVMTGPVLGLIDNTLSDNILHTLLAIVFLWAGFMGGSVAQSSSSPSSMGTM